METIGIVGVMLGLYIGGPIERMEKKLESIVGFRV